MIRLTKHARESMATREIALDWITNAVISPDRVEPDPRHPERYRSYKAIASFGGRVLRVAHRREVEDIMIITVHFDRGARR